MLLFGLFYYIFIHFDTVENNGPFGRKNRKLRGEWRLYLVVNEFVFISLVFYQIEAHPPEGKSIMI